MHYLYKPTVSECLEWGDVQNVLTTVSTCQQDKERFVTYFITYFFKSTEIAVI